MTTARFRHTDIFGGFHGTHAPGNPSFSWKRRLAAALSLLVVLVAEMAAPASLWAVETDSALAAPDKKADAPAADPDLLRAYLQVQDQLHSTQQAIDRNRQDAETAAAKNADALEAVRTMQQSLSTQRVGEIEMMQASNRLILIGGGVFSVVVLFAMALAAYFQWRAVTRLDAILSTLPPSAPLLGMPQAVAALRAGNGQAFSDNAAEQSNAHLLGALDRLQRRIIELERSGASMVNEHTALAEAQTMSGSQVVSDVAADKEKRSTVDAGNIGRMLAEGQSRLNQGPSRRRRRRRLTRCSLSTRTIPRLS